MPPPSYHSFTLKWNGRSNRITVNVDITAGTSPLSQPPPVPAVQHGALSVVALWDTGATASVVTKSTATRLGLTNKGFINVNTAGGPIQSPTYLVDIWLPNKTGFPSVLVSECPDTAGSFDVIIGMDIITSGDSTLSNFNGETWMTFRNPSQGGVDYVDQWQKAASNSSSPNQPCWCGSEKKFKHCHGR